MRHLSVKAVARAAIRAGNAARFSFAQRQKHSRMPVPLLVVGPRAIQRQIFRQHGNFLRIQIVHLIFLCVVGVRLFYAIGRLKDIFGAKPQSAIIPTFQTAYHDCAYPSGRHPPTRTIRSALYPRFRLPRTHRPNRRQIPLLPVRRPAHADRILLPR